MKQEKVYNRTKYNFKSASESKPKSETKHLLCLTSVCIRLFPIRTHRKAIRKIFHNKKRNTVFRLYDLLSFGFFAVLYSRFARLASEEPASLPKLFKAAGA